jgi:hypothetical protein
MMSWMAAPVAEVMTPMMRRPAGDRSLALAGEQALGGELGLELLELEEEGALTGRFGALGVELELALGGVDAGAAEDADALAVLQAGSAGGRGRSATWRRGAGPRRRAG